MKNLFHLIRRLVAGLLLAFVLLPPSLHGCAVCFGAPEAPMTRGLNMGIIALLAVVGCVLSGALAFVVYLGHKSSQVKRDRPETLSADQPDLDRFKGTQESSAEDRSDSLSPRPRFEL